MDDFGQFLLQCSETLVDDEGRPWCPTTSDMWAILNGYDESAMPWTHVDMDDILEYVVETGNGEKIMDEMVDLAIDSMCECRE